MIAATWPFSMVSVRPSRIFLPSTSTCRFLTSNNGTSFPLKMKRSFVGRTLAPMSAPIAASVLATEPHEPAEQGGHNQEPDPLGGKIDWAGESFDHGNRCEEDYSRYEWRNRIPLV